MPGVESSGTLFGVWFASELVSSHVPRFKAAAKQMSEEVAL
jgi:hypothetical protein